jgi:hypothetical protein
MLQLIGMGLFARQERSMLAQNRRRKTLHEKRAGQRSSNDVQKTKAARRGK